MLEKLLDGPKTYYMWLIFLLVLIAGCGLVYLDQLQNGLSGKRWQDQAHGPGEPDTRQHFPR